MAARCIDHNSPWKGQKFSVTQTKQKGAFIKRVVTSDKALAWFKISPLWVCTQSYPTLCNPMDCKTSGVSVHGISQARILESVAISSSRGSSLPMNQTPISCVSCTGRQIFFNNLATWEAHAKHIASGSLLCDARSSTWCSVTTQMGRMGRVLGGRFMKEGTCEYLWLIRIDVEHILTLHCKAMIFQLKISKFNKNKWIKHFLKNLP